MISELGNLILKLRYWPKGLGASDAGTVLQSSNNYDKLWIYPQIEGEAVEGQELTADAFFVNPLPIPLRKGEFRIEGPGLIKQLKMKIAE